jgi:DNA-binding MarR family transcriptional regulator
MEETHRTELKLGRFLPYLLSNLAENISTELAQVYSTEFGLTTSEWRVLAHLAEHESLNARQIIGFTSMEKSKVSRAVGRLCERGLVLQERARRDSRAKDLVLTESGRALYEQVVPRVLVWERELLEGLNSLEYRDLLHGLGQLTRRLELISA